MTTPCEPVPEADRRWMRLAIRLARRSMGRVAPNPAVGCVLVHDGIVIARGATAPSGRPHAEAVALERAGERARGATAYVTLEPCSHHAATPPCADALIAAGVRRVVCACQDPDPRVDGRGLARLRAAGVAVETGVCSEEAGRVMAGFARRIERSRPTVTLKLATSGDAMAATAGGESKWITGAPARRMVHLLRARHDAIVTGIGTVLADDPELTCRLPGLGDRSPIRVVIDSRASLPITSRLVKTAHEVPVLVIVAPGADRVRDLELRGAEVIECPAGDDGRVLPGGILHRLAERGVNDVMLESGGRLAAAFLGADLVDRIAWFRAPMLIGGDGMPAIGALGLSRLAAAPGFISGDAVPVGEDTMTCYGRG